MIRTQFSKEWRKAKTPYKKSFFNFSLSIKKAHRSEFVLLNQIFLKTIVRKRLINETTNGNDKWYDLGRRIIFGCGFELVRKTAVI